MDIILYFVLGTIFGIIGCWIFLFKCIKNQNDGFLIIDDMNEDKTTYILDIHVDPNDITKKKYVRFKVNVFEKNE